MPHSWDVRPDRDVPHVVTCNLCGVVVERRFDESGRGLNYYTLIGAEPVRGLAPACPGAMPAGLVAEEDAIAPSMIRPRPTTRRPRPAVQRATTQRVAAQRVAATPTITQPEVPQLAPKPHQLFMTLAENASSWAGWTLTDGSVRSTPSERGLLNILRKAGLINVKRERDTKRTMVSFTEVGIVYACNNGVDLTWIHSVKPVTQSR